MKRIAPIAVALAVLVGVPASSPAQPPSFADWLARFGARVQRDVTHIGSVCQKRHGHDDHKVGACFVKAERRSLRAEAVIWEKQLAVVAQGQRATCKKAIRAYRLASRKAARANLRYLDSHPHAALSRISRDLNQKPYTTLKTVTFAAKSRAIRVCG